MVEKETTTDVFNDAFNGLIWAENQIFFGGEDTFYAKECSEQWL